MEKPIISVVVPVYNVAKYIGQCLQTLTQQTISIPYEILAVNDGSSDCSLSILRQYADADSHVQIIDQPNSGVSAARTAGMRASRGEWICFVDGDDYVAPNYLELLYNACVLNQADIACCYYYWHMMTNDILFEYPFRCRGVYHTEEAMNLLLRDVLIQSFLWGKMYRKQLFVQADVRFPKMCFEDLAVLHKIFAQANTVAIIDEPLYYYNMHSDSTLGTINPEKIRDYIRAIAMVRSELEKSGEYEKYRDSYRSLAHKTASNCRYFAMKLHGDQKDPRGLLSDLRKVRLAIDACCAEPFSMKQVEAKLPALLEEKKKRKSVAR